MNHEDMKTEDLLARYNELAERKIKRWSSSRAELIKRIKALEPVVKKSLRGASGIGAECYALLGRIISKDAEGHDVGMAYSSILKVVKRSFPESKVNRHHLRWYANRMHELDQPCPVHREKSTWDEVAS